MVCQTAPVDGFGDLAPARRSHYHLRLSGGCSSAGRAPDCDSGCRGFEPHQPPHQSHSALPAMWYQKGSASRRASISGMPKSPCVPGDLLHRYEVTTLSSSSLAHTSVVRLNPLCFLRSQQLPLPLKMVFEIKSITEIRIGIVGITGAITGHRYIGIIGDGQTFQHRR